MFPVCNAHTYTLTPALHPEPAKANCHGNGLLKGLRVSLKLEALFWREGLALWARERGQIDFIQLRLCLSHCGKSRAKAYFWESPARINRTRVEMLCSKGRPRRYKLHTFWLSKICKPSKKKSEGNVKASLCVCSYLAVFFCFFVLGSLGAVWVDLHMELGLFSSWPCRCSGDTLLSVSWCTTDWCILSVPPVLSRVQKIPALLPADPHQPLTAATDGAHSWSETHINPHPLSCVHTLAVTFCTPSTLNANTAHAAAPCLFVGCSGSLLCTAGVCMCVINGCVNYEWGEMTGSQSTLKPAAALSLHGLTVHACVCVYNGHVKGVFLHVFFCIYS